MRLQAPRSSCGDFFNAASANISQVHYEDVPERQLASATALSCIVHPAHPLLPSVHIHISWTQYKSAPGYWRLMADLNPSHPDEQDTDLFLQAFEECCPEEFPEACRQGDAYFWIGALQRHRGVAHFYLEEYRKERFSEELAFAGSVGCASVDAYLRVLGRKLGLAELRNEPSLELKQAQLDYHTIYFFQVLTLDRGTTAGLLVHSENDVGILGSLPRWINRPLLASWVQRLDSPQNLLLEDLLAQLPQGERVEITPEVKARLAQVIRKHYRAHPQALNQQAAGSIVPKTIANHLS